MGEIRQGREIRMAEIIGRKRHAETQKNDTRLQTERVTRERHSDTKEKRDKP